MAGIIVLGLVLLTATTMPPTSGKLFYMTFDILGSGFSEIHFRSATLTAGLDQTELPSVSSDGYFTNIDCPPTSGTPCTPPIVDFTVSPTPADLAITGNELLQGRVLIFNASARSTNSGGSISNYYWIWGNPDPSQQGSNATIIHVYSIGKPYYVTVRADDSYGVSASKTKRIIVINNLIDLAVDSATVNDDAGVIPGTIISVTARVLNNGTRTEEANLTISVEGRLIGNTTFHGLLPTNRKEFTAQWKTDKYSPRVYRIDAFVDYVRKPGNYSNIIEDVLTNNLKSIFVQLVFAVVFSFASLPGALSSNVHLPSVQLAHAATAPNVPWIPAGPAFDTLVSTIYADQNAEFTQMQAGLVDVSDWPLTPALITSLGGNNGFFVTPQIASHDYDELEFHNGNNFWGCDFSFTNSACGIDIRQGIAHLLDKNILTTTQADIAGVSLPIDNALPPSLGLPTPNPCAWDALFPQSGPACVVGAAGGLAYHLAAATAGVGPSHPTFAWTPGFATPDFCAAADHFIHANLATGKNPTTCILTGINAAVSAHTVNMYDRIDDPPRYQAGQSIVEALCALFTGAFTGGCAPYVTETSGPITGFTGFTTSTTGVNQNWNMYTAGFQGAYPFDFVYFQDQSRFVSGIPSIQSPSGPCSNLAVPSFGAGNYQYICDTTFDSLATQMEFASCVSAPGDPTPGQVTPTFANCPGTTTPSSTSAGYRAEDRAGSKALSVPLFTPKSQLGYLSNWQ